MISQSRRNQIMKDLERAPLCGNDARALILQLEDMVKQQQTRIEELGRAEDGQAHLLSAEDVQRLKAGTPVAVEKLIYHDGKRVYAASWGICTGSLIISLLGTFFPDVVHEIPYEPLHLVLQDQDKRSSLLKAALRDMVAFKAKYRELHELAKVMDAVDQTMPILEGMQ